MSSSSSDSSCSVIVSESESEESSSDNLESTSQADLPTQSDLPSVSINLLKQVSSASDGFARENDPTGAGGGGGVPSAVKRD